MTMILAAALRRAVFVATPLTLALALAACGGDDNSASPPRVAAAPAPSPAPSPSPSPSPSPTPSPTSRNVSACLTQVIPGTNGATPASLILPDTLKLDTSRPAGFPNGRRLEDPVIDITLAVLFLDMTKQSPGTFAALPLNPPANDKPFLTTFPFLAPPQGNPILATGTGTSFNFRTDPFSSFVRVDREGQPAVATALIGAALKNAYNDANASDDVAGTFVPEITKQLTLLHDALADDLVALGLKVCST
jgi:hypothetical protein